MKYSQIKALISNPGQSYWYDRRYAISNEFGVIAYVHADCEQMAIDEAVDSGHMDCMAMSPEDYAEYESNGWDDSYILAGNAGEPFWCEYLSIREV